MKEVSGEPMGDDFLAREKALLGDDANQFTSTQDTAALGDASDDLLGGSGHNAQATFESQFPDITAQPQVRLLLSI